MTNRLTRKSFNIIFVFALLFCTGCQQKQRYWKFIVAADSRGDGTGNGVCTTLLSELSDEIIKRKVDLSLIAGDLVHGGQTGTQEVLLSQLTVWRQTMQPVYDAGIGVYVIRGNHDIGWEPIQSPESWNKIFSGDYAMPENGPAEPLNIPYSNAKNHINLTYSFEHKNALIIGLENYLPHNRVPQKWLDEQLAANTKPHIFIFGHEPAFSANNHEDMLTGGRIGSSPGQYVTQRDTFWTSIKKAGGRTYFCGHDHFYNHARIDDGDGNLNNDIHQLIIGTSGAGLYSWDEKYDGFNSTYIPICKYHQSQYGYILVEVNGPDVTLTWMARVEAGEYRPKEVWSYTTANAKTY